MNEDLSNHRKNVSAYIDQCLYNYSRWIKSGPKTKAYLLNNYCETIHDIDSDYKRHLQRFIANNKGFLQHRPPLVVNVQSRPPEKPPVPYKHPPPKAPTVIDNLKVHKPIKKFGSVCAVALMKTLTYLVSETDYATEEEVALALLNNPKFKQFLAEYANDFYLDLLEDGII